MELRPRKLYCKILRQSRGDGLHFWHWEIFDNTKWLIASGNAFGSRENALRAKLLQKLGITVIKAHDLRELRPIASFVLYDFAPDFDFAE